MRGDWNDVSQGGQLDRWPISHVYVAAGGNCAICSTNQDFLALAFGTNIH